MCGRFFVFAFKALIAAEKKMQAKDFLIRRQSKVSRKTIESVASEKNFKRIFQKYFAVNFFCLAPFLKKRFVRVRLRIVLKPVVIFCSTSLPLVSTKWFQSTFSSHCLLTSRQRHWLTSAMSIFFHLKFFGECWESNQGQLGLEASMLTIVLSYFSKNLPCWDLFGVTQEKDRKWRKNFTLALLSL